MKHIWSVIGTVFAAFVGFLVVIGVLWIYFLKHSTFYTACLGFVQAHPDLRDVLGEVQATSAVPLGFYYETATDGSGTGSVFLTVRGEQKKGRLVLTAYRYFSHWVIDSAKLYVDGEASALDTVEQLIADTEVLPEPTLRARLTRAMQIQPTVPEPHYLLAQWALDRARYAEAEAVLREAIAIDATYAPAHNDLGVAMMGRGQYVEALDALATAQRFAPNDPLPLINQAVIYRDVADLRDFPRARALLDAAVTLDPEEPRVYEALAELNRLEGRSAEAEAARRRATELRAMAPEESAGRRPLRP